MELSTSSGHDTGQLSPCEDFWTSIRVLWRCRRSFSWRRFLITTTRKRQQIEPVFCRMKRLKELIFPAGRTRCSLPTSFIKYSRGEHGQLFSNIVTSQQCSLNRMSFGQGKNLSSHSVSLCIPYIYLENRLNGPKELYTRYGYPPLPFLTGISCTRFCFASPRVRNHTSSSQTKTGSLFNAAQWIYYT